MLTVKRVFSLTLLAVIISMRLGGALFANTINQAYGAEVSIERGMIVGFKEDSGTVVEPVNVDQIDNMLGVVVAANDSPITLSGEEEKVFVATVGRYDVLVNDQNGAINPGDYITVSSVNGIGMLATYNESHILGRAIDGFNGTEGVVGNSELTDTNGNKRPVKIGRIQAEIGISQNPVAKSAAVTPEWLGKIGQAIAGKSLSPARIYISAAVFLIGAFIAGAVLYAGIRSSIIAIGRNPLSKGSILKGLIQVIATSLIIFIIAVGGVYLLLRV